MISKRTAAAFLAASLFFGGTFVAAKGGLAYFPPLLFVALRFDIAAVVLALAVLATRPLADVLPRTRGDVGAILAAGGLSIGLTNAFLFVGQGSVTSAVGAVVFSLNPILTPLFAALLLAEERLSRRAAAGLAIGLVGVAVALHPDPTSFLAGGTGKLLILGGAASAALGSVLIRRADADLDSTARTVWAFPVGALLTHALAAAAGEGMGHIAWSGPAAVALGYVGIFAGAVAFIAYFDILDAAGPNRANLVFYVIPLVATVGGAVVLGEAMSALTLVGFLVVFVGFAVIGTEHVDVRDRLPGSPELPGRKSIPGSGRIAARVSGGREVFVADGGTTTADDRSVASDPK